MERKLYGDAPGENPASLAPAAGDPEVGIDSQNNDCYYNYDTDVPQRRGDS